MSPEQALAIHSLSMDPDPTISAIGRAQKHLYQPFDNYLSAELDRGTAKEDIIQGMVGAFVIAVLRTTGDPIPGAEATYAKTLAHLVASQALQCAKA